MQNYEDVLALHFYSNNLTLFQLRFYFTYNFNIIHEVIFFRHLCILFLFSGSSLFILVIVFDHYFYGSLRIYIHCIVIAKICNTSRCYKSLYAMSIVTVDTVIKTRLVLGYCT